MKRDTTEITVQPPQLELIPIERIPQQSVADSRNKHIQQKRRQRDRYIYVIAALIYAWLGACIGFCGASMYFMWAMGVI